MESRIQACLGFPYMAQNFIPFTNWLLIAFQRHRVVVSEKEVNYLNQPRRSLVYFMRPDLDAQIECLDGSNKYVPITSGNYVKQKLNATYQYWNPHIKINLSNLKATIHEVPNRFLGIRDWGSGFEFKSKTWARINLGLKVRVGGGIPKITLGITELRDCTKFRVGTTGLKNLIGDPDLGLFR